MHTTQVATAQLPVTHISGKNMGGNRDVRVQVPMCAFSQRLAHKNANQPVNRRRNVDYAHR